MSLAFVQGQDIDPVPATADEQFDQFSNVTCTLTSFTPMTGVLHLSTYRLLFSESEASSTGKVTALKKISIPLQRYRNHAVKQPWFGANYYEGEVIPIKGAGLDLPEVATMRASFAFNEGGIERFHKALEHAYSIARERHRNGQGQQEEALPLYESTDGVPPGYQ